MGSAGGGKVAENMEVESRAAEVGVASQKSDGGLRSLYVELRSHQHRILVNFRLGLAIRALQWSNVPKKSIQN